jgi:hypothetical protein
MITKLKDKAHEAVQQHKECEAEASSTTNPNASANTGESMQVDVSSSSANMSTSANASASNVTSPASDSSIAASASSPSKSRLRMEELDRINGRTHVFTTASCSFESHHSVSHHHHNDPIHNPFSGSSSGWLHTSSPSNGNTTPGGMDAFLSTMHMHPIIARDMRTFNNLANEIPPAFDSNGGISKRAAPFSNGAGAARGSAVAFDDDDSDPFSYSYKLFDMPSESGDLSSTGMFGSGNPLGFGNGGGMGGWDWQNLVMGTGTGMPGGVGINTGMAVEGGIGMGIGMDYGMGIEMGMAPGSGTQEKNQPQASSSNHNTPSDNAEMSIDANPIHDIDISSLPHSQSQPQSRSRPHPQQQPVYTDSLFNQLSTFPSTFGTVHTTQHIPTRYPSNSWTSAGGWGFSANIMAGSGTGGGDRGGDSTGGGEVSDGPGNGGVGGIPGLNPMWQGFAEQLGF